MHIEELDYELPEELIALRPLPERDAGRMAVVEIGKGLVAHSRVLELPRSIRPALFVVNNSRVIPARLFAQKSSGAEVEILLVEASEGHFDEERLAQRWRALVRGQKRLRIGTELRVKGAPLRAKVLALFAEGGAELLLESEGLTIREAIAQAGRLPLPPYIRREADAEDLLRYQTIFASRSGSVAAPTAGLHFTPRLLEALEAHGHRLTQITLHVGPGTFLPIRTSNLDEHAMHAEAFEVSEEAAQAIREARAEKRPIVAVGTTVFRTLESAALPDRTVRPGSGRTCLFVRPPYEAKVVDALFTNLHLPRSTLIALVMAFAGIEPIRQAYRECVKERYRFFSYGDAMLIRKSEDAR